MNNASEAGAKRAAELKQKFMRGPNAKPDHVSMTKMDCGWQFVWESGLVANLYDDGIDLSVPLFLPWKSDQNRLYRYFWIEASEKTADWNEGLAQKDEKEPEEPEKQSVSDPPTSQHQDDAGAPPRRVSGKFTPEVDHE